MAVDERISVIIPTWRRVEKMRLCFDAIYSCLPQPCEVLVHIDAGDDETERYLSQNKWGKIRWFKSKTTQGPGGGRNLLVRQAKTPYLCSLDDDSWPMENDFFERAVFLMDEHSSAAVITLNEVRPGQSPIEWNGTIRKVTSFQGCACLMRRQAFEQINGYVPLRYAYGMEEADVSLQLMDAGWDILKYDGLHVYHDTTLEHQAGPAINSAHIANIALLAFLRYPVIWWPIGFLQILNRVRYAVKVARYRGIMSGLCNIPITCWKYRRYRKTVKASTLRARKELSR